MSHSDHRSHQSDSSWHRQFADTVQHLARLRRLFLRFPRLAWWRWLSLSVLPAGQSARSIPLCSGPQLTLSGLANAMSSLLDGPVKAPQCCFAPPVAFGAQHTDVPLKVRRRKLVPPFLTASALPSVFAPLLLLHPGWYGTLREHHFLLGG